MIIAENGKFIGFGEYVLSESIMPKPISYGTDLSNGEWKADEESVYTFFTVKDKYYMVALDRESGMVGFGASEVWMDNPSFAFIQTYFSDTPRQAMNAIRVFGHVTYLILEAVELFEIDSINFAAFSHSLGRVYDALSKNKFFLDKLQSLGFEYAGEQEGQFGKTYVYQRK